MKTKKPPENLDVLRCPLSGMSLIEASAGTGKTWNICALYLRLLLEKKLSVREIMVVTFTNAATAELKERIRTRIMEALLFLEEKTEAENANAFFVDVLARQEQAGTSRKKMADLLKAAIASFDEATISTIHGFCRKVTGTLAFGTAQPFSFTVEHEERETLNHVVHDFWRRHVAGDTQGKTMARYLNAIRLTPDKLLLFLRREMEKPRAVKRWPDNRIPFDESETKELVAAYERLEKSWHQYRDTLPDIITAAVSEKVLSGRKFGNPDLLFEACNTLFSQKDPTAIFLCSDTATRDHLWRLTTSGLEEGANKNKTPPSHPFFTLAEDWLNAHDRVIARLEGAYLCLLKQLQKGAEEVRERRREKRILTSSDILYHLYEALQNIPSLPDAIRRMYPAALIDEFQDTDPVQFFIFKTIYAESNASVFFVGDPKQAIYRFRNADLHTYLAAREKVKAGQRYSLTQNHRSAPEMIKACNAIFRRNPRAFMLEGLDSPEVSPGERQREILADESDHPKKNGMEVWRLPQREDGNYLSRREAFSASAEAVADEIVRLLQAGQQNRIRIGDEALNASNIAILVRTHNEARRMQQALARRSLSSVSLSPGSVWDSPDAAELEIILSAITTPRNQPRLRAALATEMLGHNAKAIGEFSNQDDKQLDLVKKFMKFQTTWLENGISFVLRQIMSEYGVYTRMLTLPNGERRLTNILHLAELLNEAGQTHTMPEALLRWMGEQRENHSSNEQTQIRLESDEKLITIMTIYAAKGLEFPFVFCPFLWDAHNGNLPGGADGMEYQDGKDFVIDFRKHEEEVENAIKSKMAIEDAADRIRLIYVALTRAVYRCYIVAGCYAVSASLKQTTRGTLNWLAVETGITPETWIARGDKERVGLIETGWQALANMDAGITLTNLPAGDQPITVLPDMGENQITTLQAAELLKSIPKSIPAGWRIGSYSGLVYGAVHEAPTSDHDEWAQGASPPDVPVTAPEADDIFLFPAGRHAGNCLHAVFELVDFSDENTWDTAIAEALLRHPPYGRTRPEAGKTHEELAAMIRRMLKNVLTTPLHANLTLSRIGLEKRLTELEFFMPTENLSPSALHTLLSSDFPLPKLTFAQLKGYIKGLIDLVFEHDGRFYILDWKSNFLGNHQGDYGDEAIHTAMIEHHYHLQHLLYTVALNRYLAKRMPDYAYDTHFGGVLYLFVRGVRPGWKKENGTPSGVFFCRTDESLVHKLDALLSAGGEK